MKKRYWVLIIVGILMAVIGGAVWFIQTRRAAPPEAVTVQPQDIAQDIEFTGRLQAHESAELGFESSGVAATVAVEVGEPVTAGQTLATLDRRTVQLDVAKAYADRVSAETAARLLYDHAVTSQGAVQATNARTLESARQNVRNAKHELDQAKAVWEQVVRESGDESSTAKVRYAAVIAAESAYKSAQAALAEAEKSTAKTAADAHSAAAEAYAAWQATRQAANAVAGLSSLSANEQIARVRLSKTVLTAPFSGTITAKHIAPGELAVGGQSVLTIQTTDHVEVEAQVVETDITKLAVGMPATITLDTYESTETWPASVASIDPAAELVEGVPTYRMILRLDSSDARLRPGLTAQVAVHTANKQGVLVLPRRAITRDGARTYVQVLRPDGTIEERTVTTGLTSTDGRVEITSGLTSGDRVVTRQSRTN